MAVGAPVCAEYLSAYLSSTGKPFELVGGLIFFTPLYGGAALLIRELAVRRGLGWRGRLLFAAAFGLAMTSVIDLSLWTVHRPEIEYWDDLQTTTRLGSLGFAVYPALVWVLGHVVLSIGAPIAIVEALAGDLRDQSWLRVPGLVVWSVLFVAVAVSIHGSEGSEYDVHPSAGQYTGAVLIIVLLVCTALSRWGRPLARRDRPAPGIPVALLLGVVLMACLDFAPISWAGAVVALVATVVAAVLLLRWGSSPDWTHRQVSAVAVGALALRTFTSFLSPVPEGVDPVAKVVQSLVVVVLVLGLCAWLWRASWSRRAPGHRHNDAVSERTPPPDREDYVVWRQATTRWADDDVYGHMNNAVYFELIDTAVNAHLAEETGVDIRSLPAIGVVAEVSCRYFREIGYPEPVDLGMVVDKVGSSSVIYRIGLFQGDPEGAGARAAAEGRFVHVYVDNTGDRSEGRPVAPIPDQVREAVVPLLRE